MNLVGAKLRNPAFKVWSPRDLAFPRQADLIWENVVLPISQRRGWCIYRLVDMAIAKDEVNESSWPRGH